MKNEFLLALVGGLVIGFASALPLWWHGRIAGASGLLSDILTKEKVPGLMYGLGLVAGAFSLLCFKNHLAFTALPVDWKLIVSGVLVGFGARLGSGCTSGHGICGMARLSIRSIVATCVFLGVAMLVANLVRALS